MALVSVSGRSITPVAQGIGLKPGSTRREHAPGDGAAHEERHAGCAVVRSAGSIDRNGAAEFAGGDHRGLFPRRPHRGL